MKKKTWPQNKTDVLIRTKMTRKWFGIRKRLRMKKRKRKTTKERPKDEHSVKISKKKGMKGQKKNVKVCVFGLAKK